MAKKPYSRPPSNNEAGVLARLWRNTLEDLNLTGKTEHLIDVYVNRKDRVSSRVVAAKQKDKSTLKKNAHDPGITFKTFIDLIFSLLNVRFIDITITLTHSNGAKTIHTTRAVRDYESEPVLKEENNPEEQ